MDKRFKIILDFVVVLVSSIGPMTIFRLFTIDLIPLPFYFGQLLFVLFCYVIRFGMRPLRLSPILKKSPLFILLMIIYGWEMLQGLLTGNTNAMAFSILLMSHLVCLCYLSMLLKRNGGYEKILKPISYFAIISVCAIILCAVLMIAGVITRYDNPIGVNALTRDNIENNNTTYNFPGFLSIVSQLGRLSIFGDLPLFCGFSHEPHVLWHTIMPFLLLSIFWFRNKNYYQYIVYGAILITFIFALSATALMCFGAVFAMDLIYKAIIKKNVKQIILVIIFITILSYYIISNIELINQVSAFMDNKLDSNSRTDSVSMLTYFTNSRSILGYGFSSPEFGRHIMAFQCGILSSFLIISFVCSFFYISFANFLSKKSLNHYIGLSCIYYGLHSMKLGPMAMPTSYLVFMVFILVIANASLKKKKEYLLVA